MSLHPSIEMKPMIFTNENHQELQYHHNHSLPTWIEVRKKNEKNGRKVRHHNRNTGKNTWDLAINRFFNELPHLYRDLCLHYHPKAKYFDLKDDFKKFYDIQELEPEPEPEPEPETESDVENSDDEDAF